MNLFSFSGILTGLSSLIFGFFVYFKGRKNRINQIFLFFAISVAIWGFGVYKIGIALNFLDALFWWRISYIGVIFIPVFFLHFTYLFLKFKERKLIKLVYLITFFYLFIDYSDLFMKDIRLEFSSIYYISSSGFFYPLFVFFWFTTVTYAHYELFKAHKESFGIKKVQIKYFFLAMVIGFAGGGTCFLPIFNINIYPFLNFTVPLYPAIMAYAIVRHHLMDIRVVIQRGIIYSALFSTIIGIYLVLIFLLGFFFQQATDVAMMLAALITTVACVYTVPIIEKYFKKWTDKIFFKDKYDYSEAVFSLSEILNKNINLDTLLKESAKMLKNILKIKDLRIILPKQNMFLDTKGEVKIKSFSFIKDFIKTIEYDDITCLVHDEIPVLLKSIDKKSEKYKALKMAEIYGKKFNILVTVPIKLENKLMGLLVLGKKLSGDIYTNEDYSLLKTFSFQAGVALEKSQLYEKVKNYSEDLEQKVKTRVAEIKDLQEEQKQMMLEISHGLQTPLTIIKGELHNLESQVDDKKNIKYLEKNLDRISMFIYDMLRLARMENQKDKFGKEEFDLSELLFDLIENFKIITSEKNILLKSSIEKNIVFNGSKKEIEELIMNIVGNSVKYFGEKKNNEIDFILKKKGGIIELSIADTGIGIKKEKIPKLFSRFYRAGEDNRGTGLGLAICKEIVNRHLGEIRVESKEGEGTKVIILLPLTKNENKEGKV